MDVRVDPRFTGRGQPSAYLISFEVMLPSACSFIVDGLAFCCRCSHYMFRPTWPSSGVCVCMIFHFLFLKESASLLLLSLLHVVILCSF
jgi:hypothetical protein